MKNIYLIAIYLVAGNLFTRAQNIISIAAGTDMYIVTGTAFYSGGLVLNPASGFTFNGVNITKATTVSHTASNNYVSRVYQFSNNTNPFTGTIQFYYSDPELNGLNETNLRVNIHDGIFWQAFTSAANNITGNYVLTTSITGKIMNELALADVFAALPLLWGNINAYRFEKTNKIEWTTLQEFNVSYFTLQRSIDQRTWSMVLDNIIATNTPYSMKYAVSDNNYYAGRLYYRVKQTDTDGKSAYSSLAAVSADNETGGLFVYPNPVNTEFYIGHAGSIAIKQVQLYAGNGSLVKSWAAAQAAYNISSLTPGLYHLRIQLKDGSGKYIKLNKQ